MSALFGSGRWCSSRFFCLPVEHRGSKPAWSSPSRVELDNDIAEVAIAITEYIDPPAQGLWELRFRSDAVVVGRPETRIDHQSSAGTPQSVYTFAVDEVIEGEVADEFELVLEGGVERQNGASVLVESQQSAQFRPGSSYLLFLRERDLDDRYDIVGPAAGRYLVEDGVITHGYEVDIQGPQNEPRDAGYYHASVDDRSIVGMRIEEVLDPEPVEHQG